MRALQGLLDANLLRLRKEAEVKVLFLDIDGVLNSHTYWHRRPAILRDRLHDLDSEAIARLNTVIKRTGAMVVVSSTWRILNTRTELQEILTSQGFTGTVFGTTGTGKDRKKERGLEIQAWLDKPRYRDLRDPRRLVERFAIVDDDSDMAHLLPHLVKTTMYGDDGGLQDEHVEQLVELLGEL